MMSTGMARTLVRQANLDGGATVDPYTLRPVRSGVVVGDGRSERTVTTDDLDTLADTVLTYVSDHVVDLSDPGRYLGLWHDGPDWVLDVVTVLRSESDALTLARRLGERAVYNLTTSTEVQVS